MSNTRSTDNFLPRSQTGSAYVPRPAVYIPRRGAVRHDNPQQPISDILPSTPPVIKNQPEPLIELVLPARPTPVSSIARPRPKRVSRAQLVAALLTIALIIGAAASLISFREQPQTVRHAEAARVAANTVTAPSRAVAWPVRLIIPKIAVNAPLDYVRLTPQGALDIPHEPGNAGWYDKGPRPGEKGVAIIDGHSGWRDNIPAVFDQLHKLLPGDLIQVKDERGQTVSFVVRELRTYQKDQADREVFVTNDDKIHLNLITCEGAWNEAQKSYTDRLVVFADKYSTDQTGLKTPSGGLSSSLSRLAY